MKEPDDMTLPELTALRKTLDEVIALGVRKSRLSGDSWAAVGRLLGVTAQEAHRRYRWVERPPLQDTPTPETTAGP